MYSKPDFKNTGYTETQFRLNSELGLFGNGVKLLLAAKCPDFFNILG
jgi:hypothetical protein